ncbi:MAG: PAS domain S-box protein [Chitinispirillaceae bacterium]|nr:PAS domain S-box protein [Chitinispirillaceae bacterium]
MNNKTDILVINDTATSLTLMVNLLTDAGYLVQTADSGELALAAVAVDPPELILIDIKMNGMDGLEVCRRLKANGSTKHIPIILISAFVDTKEWVTGLQLGAADYINKPFQAEELLARVKTQLTISQAVNELRKQAAALQKANELLHDEATKRQLREDELHRSLEKAERSRRALLSMMEDHKRAVEELRESEVKFRNVFDNSAIGKSITSFDGTVNVNTAFCRMLGYTSAELSQLKWQEISHPDDIELTRKNIESLQTGEKKSVRFTKRYITKSGTVLWADVNTVLQYNKDGKLLYYMTFIMDITERIQADSRVQLSRDTLELLNRVEDTTETIEDILKLIKKSTGIEAVGIRLREGNDYPYYKTEGFPDHFVKAERYLCAYDANGNCISDGLGNPLLECMCGNIICGRTDPELPFFTKSGSFWSNGTSELLASTTEKDRQSPTRNRCNGEGYESVALIPLRSGYDIIGLLQLNDHRENRFTTEIVHYFEGLGAAIGIALSRKHAEEKLRFRNLILSTQQETSIDGILIVDENGKIISYNRRFVAMWAIPQEVMESKSDERVLRSVLDKLADPEEFIGRVEQLYANRHETSRDEIGLKDGRTFDRYSAPMFGADNKYYGCVWYFRDITGNKLAEDALRESEERFKAIVDNIRDGILVADISTRKLLFGNQAISRMLGYTADELGNLSVNDIHPQKDLTAVFDAFDKQARGEIEVAPNLPVLRKDGGVFYADVNSFPLNLEGKFYMAGVFNDITGRCNMEKEKEHLNAQLVQAQKLEAIGALAGGVAHDFNNLLTAISGFISLAMMKLEESDPVHRDLKQASNAAVRAGGVVRQLLLFSRKQPMEPVSLNLNDIVTSLFKMLYRLIGEDITIDMQLDPDGCAIEGDEGNIEQVIMNLAVNARDAMPQGGTITIGTQNVDIDEKYCRRKSEARPGKFVLLSITDTGTGISAEAMAHIFEPFFTTKEKGKGTGLGLSVVYGIVKQHKGWISVESNPEQGTTFQIYLPSSSKKIAHKTADVFRIENYRGAGERILVVEDQEEVRELAIEVLTTNGYTVFDAETAEKARELFAREKGDFALVFSDIVLPDVSGIRLVEELSSGRKLHVLFSSGYTDDKSCLSLIREKNYRFLQKPYTIRSLLVAVREVLESEVSALILSDISLS